MIAGELDISIGSMILASSMTIAIISGHYDGPIWLGILAALALGALVGVINGVLVVRTAVPSFIVTLGTLFAVAGLTLGLSVLLTGTTSVAIKAAQRPSFFWATSSAAAIRSPSCGGWLLLPCFGSSCTIPNTATGYGNWIFAMGGDKVSARNEGIPTERLTIILFMCSGVSAAFVGLSQAILYNSAQVSAGQSHIFNAIIAVVVGGCLVDRRQRIGCWHIPGHADLYHRQSGHLPHPV